MMPQKKNPDPLELVRGKTGRAIGRLTGLAGDDEGSAERLQQGSAGGQGSGVRRRSHAARRRSLRTRAVVSRLVDQRGAREPRRLGLLLATDVADYLVSRGMPFRRAHEVVGAHGPPAAGRGTRLQLADPEPNGAKRARCSAKMHRGRPPRSPRCRRDARRSPPTLRRSEPRWTSAGSGSRRVSGLKRLC